MIGFDAVMGRIKSLNTVMENAALSAADETAPEMEGFAKENRKWTDRTSHARQGLTGAKYHDPGKVVGCRIWHKVDYAKWLEKISGGKFAILKQTRNAFSSVFFGRVRARIEAALGGKS